MIKLVSDVPSVASMVCKNLGALLDLVDISRLVHIDNCPIMENGDQLIPRVTKNDKNSPGKLVLLHSQKVGVSPTYLKIYYNKHAM